MRKFFDAIIWRLLLSLIFGFGSLSVTASPYSHTSWAGEYRFNEEGETLIDGSQVSISTKINISDDSRSAVVKITTWHALFSCDGPYNVIERDGVLALNYVGEKDNCSYPAPQYEIKKVKGVAYIRSDLIVYQTSEWVRLSQ